MSRRSLAFTSGLLEGIYVGSWIWSLSGDMPYGYQAWIVFIGAPICFLFTVPFGIFPDAISPSSDRGRLAIVWYFSLPARFVIGMIIMLGVSLSILYMRGVFPF